MTSERIQFENRIEELETLCAEAYVVIGSLAEYLPDAKILDNLSQMKLVHKDVLPFVRQDWPNEDVLRQIKLLVELADGWEDGETFYKGTVEAIRALLAATPAPKGGENA